LILRLQPQPKKDPFCIQWHITNLCNLRCAHCYQDDHSKKNDLDWTGLKRVSENIGSCLAQWGRKASVNLTGGEPLLKPELFLLLDEMDRMRSIDELGIITNGLLMDHEILEKLSSFSKLKKIKISLDGADAETNDSVRPEGTFEKVIRALSLVKETRFEIDLMFTVMKRNFRNLPSLIGLCEDLGVQGLLIERFIPWGRGSEIRDDMLDRETWQELMELLLAYFSIEDRDSLLSYQAFQIRFEDEGPELLGAPCVVGSDGLCIMPEASVFPCRRFPLPIGNLLNDSLSRIWESSELLEKLRCKEYIKGKCGRCDMPDCRGCRSLALSLTGDYLEEDPHCWHGDV
jgi:MoaA/NifB/PqqE/SkfB family radical SAM enzyme